MPLQVAPERHKLRQRQHVPPPRAVVREALRGRQSQLCVCTLQSHEHNSQVKYGLGKRGVAASQAKRVDADLEANISFALVSVDSRTHRAYDYSVSRLYTLNLACRAVGSELESATFTPGGAGQKVEIEFATSVLWYGAI